MELLFSLDICIVRIQNVRVDFARSERLFNLSAEAIINVRKARLCVRCAIYFEDQTNSFFLSIGPEVYIFEENPTSIEDVFGDVFCRSKNSFKREKCDTLDGYVTTPRSIYGCGKFGAWLFVHKVLPFMLQEHVKTTKTDKTRFLFAKNRITCYRQTIVR